ncbi:MAG: GNAT family N-acetyltransferase [Chloroflexota bacterium]
MTIQLHAFSENLDKHTDTIVDIWNAACPDELPISPKLVNYNVTPSDEIRQNCCLAIDDANQPVGFILASHFVTYNAIFAAFESPNQGLIDAMGVHPDAQRKGVGTALLTWAETWLQERGCQQIRLGGSLRPFAPGLPVEFDGKLGSGQFFEQHGYQTQSTTWDVMSNVAMYTTSSSVRAIAGVARPARKRDKNALLNFLQREFPGRWHYECDRFLAEGGRISDYMLLWAETGKTETGEADDLTVQGFCQLTFEDSYRPIERFYPYTLPRPWGQLGPIGVSKAARGQGYAAALIDASMRRFFNNGINGCVIDWTDLLDFYAKFGFGQYREYQMRMKELKVESGELKVESGELKVEN